VKKPECEKAIRHLCRQWFDQLPTPKPEHPSWSTFKRRLADNHYSGYLNFRSTRGADADAEMWFNQVLRQTWRC
jgi:hypothetical protein